MGNFSLSPEMQEHIRFCQWLLRKGKWTTRLAKFIRPHYCGACVQKSYCRRLEANELFQRLILRGEDCPDFKNVLENI